jgi:hypothetical protein
MPTCSSMLQCRAIRSAGGWPRFSTTAAGVLAGAGSVLLLPEVLGKPLRDGAAEEVQILAGLLARLDLRPVDRATAELATALCGRYRLRGAGATHLATAVGLGADVHHEQSPRFPADDQGGRDHLSGRPAWRPQLRARPRSAEGGLGPRTVIVSDGR